MAKDDFVVKIEDGRIMFMTSYRDEFGEDKRVANIISKERLTDIYNNIKSALAKLTNEHSNCNMLPVSQRSELLAFMRFVSKTPQTELELYSNEELVDGYLKANCG